MHISVGFWANSSKGGDAKPPVYGTLLGCDGIWKVAQVWVDPRTAGLPTNVGRGPRQYSILINPLLTTLQTRINSCVKPLLTVWPTGLYIVWQTVMGCTDTLYLS